MCIDQLEQYSRRTSVRISGVKESELGDDLITMVTDILANINPDITGQFRGDGRTVRTLVFCVYKICCITGSYLWVIQKDITQ